MNWFNNSRLFEMARLGRRLTHIAAVVPLTIVFAILSQLGALPIILAEGTIYGFSANIFG